MVKILTDTYIKTLEVSINEVKKEIGLPIQSLTITPHNYVDYHADGQVRNQWVDYIAVIVFDDRALPNFSADCTDEDILKIDFYDFLGSASIGMSDEAKIKYWRALTNKK